MRRPYASAAPVGDLEGLKAQERSATSLGGEGYLRDGMRVDHHRDATSRIVTVAEELDRVALSPE